MPFVASPTWGFPPSMTHWRLRWLDYRLRRLDCRRTPKRARLEAIRHERIAIDMQSAFGNPGKHDTQVKLKEEQGRLERELEPLDQSFQAISHTRARHLTAMHNK